MGPHSRRGVYRGCAMPIYRVEEPVQGRVAVMQWRRGVRRNLSALGLSLLFTFVGLLVLEDRQESLREHVFDALWNASNTLTTLGDLQKLNHGQKIFMIFAMFVSTTIVAYALSSLGGTMASPDIVAYRENRRMHRMLASMKHHVIVVGFTDIGQRVAHRLRDSGRKVVVIEESPALAEQASADNFAVVQGAANKEETQREAGVERADGLVVTVSEVEQKLAMTLIARALNPAMYISAIGNTEAGKDWLSHAGATDVILANEIIASTVVTRMSQRVQLNAKGVADAERGLIQEERGPSKPA